MRPQSYDSKRVTKNVFRTVSDTVGIEFVYASFVCFRLSISGQVKAGPFGSHLFIG